jgi:hypothetical protein
MSTLNSDNSDRRHAPRTILRCEASVGLADNRRVIGSTVDLSTAGVCLSLPVAMEPGERCELRINIGTVNRVEIVEMQGRVCFCVPQRLGYRIGLHCTEIDPDAASLISDLLSGAIN